MAMELPFSICVIECIDDNPWQSSREATANCHSNRHKEDRGHFTDSTVHEEVIAVQQMIGSCPDHV
jgi:hypothetical protein